MPFPVLQNRTFASAYWGCQSTSGTWGMSDLKEEDCEEEVELGSMSHTFWHSHVPDWQQQRSKAEALALFHIDPLKPLLQTLVGSVFWAKWDFGMTFLEAIPSYQAFKGLR